jgi:prophage DNA circulation protein
MKFGELKSKIEKCLAESYSKNSMKKDLFVFKELVLENKNISKLFYLYDELSQKKGLSEDVANEYLNQATKIYENTINKISPKTFSEINSWVGHIKTTNDYSNVDNLFSTGLLQLEDKIKSKKVICENLQKTEIKQEKEVINVPLNSMLSVANKTVKSYVSSLNEEEQKEVYKILSTPKEKLIESYNDLKEVVLEKLENQKSQSDQETKQTIDQVVNKLTTESFNELNYFKLKTLSEGL